MKEVNSYQYRRYLYEYDLWVEPEADRFRQVSAAFYRSNPSCTNRLLPWLNRELRALLGYQFDIEYVLQKIMTALTRHEIASEFFKRMLEPFLMDKTHHFLHELYHFAKSTHSMEYYSTRAVYVPRDNVEILQRVPQRIQHWERPHLNLVLIQILC